MIESARDVIQQLHDWIADPKVAANALNWHRSGKLRDEKYHFGDASHRRQHYYSSFDPKTMDTQIFDSTAGKVAIVIATIYIIGGLIVNLYLSRYNVTDYQILRVKYLVVGLIYFVNTLGAFLVAMLLATTIVALTSISEQVLLVISLCASAVLLWLGASSREYKSARINAVLQSWPLWIVLGAISFLYPFMVLLQQIIGHRNDFYSQISIGVAIIVGALAAIGQLYFYARYIYDKGGFDPIGTGIPVVVQLLGKEEDISQLQKIGIPLLESVLTDKVMLLDETDDHYIVGIGSDQNIQAIKISKDSVKVVRYLGYKNKSTRKW